MIARTVIQTTVLFALVGALLFGGAGTFDWPAAWAFLFEMLALSVVTILWLFARDPGLLAERLKPPIQPGQPQTDQILLGVFILLHIAWLAFMGLDARRFGWSSLPVWLQAVGAIGVALSLYVSWLAFRENTFAAPAVKIQSERGQKVITTGPYRHVRHPMYAGAILFLLGAPLMLGSLWGLVLAPVLIALLAARTFIEEKVLKAELPGYDEYASRVRYRLIPGVW